jgi:PAS domain S-box-containing protein
VYGSAFTVHFLYTFLLLTVTSLLMIELLYTSKALYRGQAAAIFCGTAFPWITNLMSLIGPVEGDLTPLGLLFSASLYTVAVVRYRLVDLVPIARDSVLDTVTDGIVVIGQGDRIVDMNPAGRELLDVADEEAVVGEDMASVFDDPELVEQYHSFTDDETASKAEVVSDGKHYEARVRPILDAQDRHVGWVFVIADITERKEREEKLQQQNERLDQFASLVSHDLRNPLNVADGYIDVARQTGDMEYLDEIQTSHQRMETIIEDVLTLTREGEDVTDPEPVNVGSTARQAWEHVDTQGAELRVRADETVLADEDRLARLLENLYRNSIEHGPETTPADLTIIVSLDHPSETDGLRILVEDDGVGIPEEMWDEIFDHGYTTEKEGTGLGLSIVSQIAQAHGWQASVGQSDAGGARFVLDGVEPTGEDVLQTTDRVPSHPSSSW